MLEAMIEVVVDTAVVLTFFILVFYGLALIVTGGRINQRIFGMQASALAAMGSLGGTVLWIATSGIRRFAPSATAEAAFL